MSQPICIDYRIGHQGVLLELILVPSGSCRRLGTVDYPASTTAAAVTPIIEVPHAFLLGQYPVSQAQWLAVIEGDNDLSAATEQNSWLSGAISRTPSALRNRTPAEGITAELASRFCRRLSAMTGKRFSLPTEDEWEYACRSGSDSPYSVGDPDLHPKRYYGTMESRTGYSEIGPLPGSTPAIHFGLLGMQAYLPEWCIASTMDGALEEFALRGSSRNSNLGNPLPAWYRAHTEPLGFSKSGGCGFRVRYECEGGALSVSTGR